MKVIYIAGKYRGPTPWAVEQNIRAAEEVAARVIQAGMMPLCPHKNTAHMEGLADDQFFLAGTLELMRRCDAVLLVPNWRDSAGARAEAAEAERMGLPVFGDFPTPRIDAVNAAMEQLDRWHIDQSETAP
jgi:nucleoside 2-deoxyribosyltransferase